MGPYLAAALRARRVPACSHGAAAAVADPSALGRAARLRRSSALARQRRLRRVRSVSDMGSATAAQARAVGQRSVHVYLVWCGAGNASAHRQAHALNSAAKMRQAAAALRSIKHTKKPT